MKLLHVLFVIVLVTLSEAQLQQCNADNCLRALNNTAPSASAFCSSYTAATKTVTTGFPTRYTSACGTNPSRYSSACTCLATPTPCAPPNDAIQNGGFECGIKPWAPYIHNPNGSYALTSPGRPGSVGAHAFTYTQVPWDLVGQDGRANGGLDQSFTLQVGASYKLGLWVLFSDKNAGYFSANLNEGQTQTLQYIGVHSEEEPKPAQWNYHSITITAERAQNFLRVSFGFANFKTLSMSVDDISIVKI